MLIYPFNVFVYNGLLGQELNILNPVLSEQSGYPIIKSMTSFWLVPSLV